MDAKTKKPAKTTHIKTKQGKQVPLKSHNPANQLKNMPGYSKGGMVKGKC